MAAGEGALSTSELIAILLRTGSGDESVVRLAERVVLESGGLNGLANRSIEELCEIKGIGPAKAVEIKAALELGRRLMTKTENPPQIKCPADAANLLIPEMGHLEQEHLRAILLDTKSRVLGIPTVYKGSLNSAAVRVAEVFKDAIRANAASVLVAHNHPSGDPTPSAEDVRVTKHLVEAGNLLNIKVVDHLVIGKGCFVSMKEKGLGF